MAFQLAWLWLIGAGVLAAGGSALAVWALFADRSRGRKRCAKCWYDMSATAGLKCPECGREARGERGLLRTRRRWWWAVVGVGLVVGAWPVFKAPEMQRDGWMAVIPTDVLVRIVPVGADAWIPGAPNPWMKSLSQKYAGPKHPLLVHLLSRCTRAYAMKPRHWRALLDRYFDANPDDFFALVQTRSSWARGGPVYARRAWDHPLVNIGFPPGDDVLRIRARIPGSDHEWKRLSRGLNPGNIVAVAPSEGDTFRLEVEIARNGTVVWQGLSPQIKLVDSAEEAIAGYDRPGLAKQVEQYMRPQLLLRSEENNLVLGAWRFCCHFDESPDSPDWALGFRAEVYCDGALVAHTSALYHMVEKNGNANFMVLNTYFPLTLTPNYKVGEATAIHSWRIRITGDAAASLADLDRSTYWSGSFEAAVNEPKAPDSFIDDELERGLRDEY